MSEGILSGPEILRQIELGSIEIDPFRKEHVNPVSVDLTLGDQVVVYSEWVETHQAPGMPLGSMWETLSCVVDMKEEQKVRKFKIGEQGILLQPGILYLMHTAERVLAKGHVPVLDGKSSIGRLGIMIHQTAGFGDPGFDGQYTLEVTTVHPVLIYAGVRFCQIRFHSICGEVASYQSHRSNYLGDLARGPVPSRAWKMFGNEDKA